MLGAAFVVLTLGAAPLFTSAADHIDASAFGSIGSPGGPFAPNSINGERDINDVYAFQGSVASRTVLVMTTNPAINLFGGKFGSNVRYILNVDTNGDAVQDVAYVVRFDNRNEGNGNRNDGAHNNHDDGDNNNAAGGGNQGNGAGNVDTGNQSYTVERFTGSNAVSLAQGDVIGSGSTEGDGTASLTGDGKVFAGVRSDPFFFDLTGFAGTLFKIGTDKLGVNPTDFFVSLNTNAIVLEVPDSQLGGAIGVWGQTTWWDGTAWQPGDQMGRPAINTVFNTILVEPAPGAASLSKNQFNATPPSQQRTAFGGKFRTNVITTLTNINAVLMTGQPDYTVSAAQGLADFLLPDVLTYDTATIAGALNGRDLNDDVIDIELGITTNGSVTSDGVGPHGDYMSTFPYLGAAH